jgi:DnaJ-class molecular chaperone
MDGPKTGYKDYYYILGVGNTATQPEITFAYQELYDRFGPHVSVMGQDPDAMLKAYKDICEAYEVLNDPIRRRNYDQNEYPHLDKHDIHQLWGRMTGGLPPTKTNNSDATRYEVQISLREAIKGTVRKLRIEEHLPCKNCAQLKPMQRMKCDQCRGTGHIASVRNEDIPIPPKSYDKQELLFPQRGRYDLRANYNVDLAVVVSITPHHFFVVSGRDVGCTVPVTVLEAVLGGEIQVPTPTGKVIMKIQPLSQNGRIYRLKGLGLGGDLLAQIQIVIPSQINVDELEVYKKLAAVSPKVNPRQELLEKLQAENAASQT